MSNLAMCRVCLAVDVRLFPLLNTPLQEIYEKITNILLSPDDSRPALACFLCRSRLQKCYILMKKALNAEQVLIQWLQSGIELTQLHIDRHSYSLSDGLCISPVEHFSTVHVEPIDDIKENSESVVKSERVVKEELLKDDVKEAEEKRAETCQQPDGNQWSSSDSEDDVPLQAISSKTKHITEKILTARVRKRRWKRKEDRSEKGFTADFAREIVLSKEQQLSELAARSRSLNYLNSPLQCALCFRGFVDARAYDNHKRKHDESSGPHECEICRMRYSTPRQLRTHTHTAHSRRYQCGQCSHQSHTANQAREHEKWHSGYTYECKLCGQAFRKPTSYLTHMRKRHPTQHSCDVCGDSFIGRHGLLMHKSKSHRGDKPLENSSEPASDRFCGDCNIQFLSLDAWKRHILTSARHTVSSNEPSPQCKICGARFPSSSALSVHLREHERSLKAARSVPISVAPTKELACDQCSSIFVNRSKLQAHVKRKHLGLKYNKNIVCEVCGKKCTSNASLKYHQRTHTGEKPYQCGVCSKRFADKNQLRIHTRTHTGERPYCCAVCGKRFSQKPALNRHYRVHTGAKPYICQFCSKPFSQSNSLTLHVRTVHLKMPPNRRHKHTDTQKTEESKVETTIKTVAE